MHGIVAKTEIDRHVESQLARVGLDPTYKSRYPHQFSGGQRARIGIARALAVEPDFLVCDESVAGSTYRAIWPPRVAKLRSPLLRQA